jgi:hypothetical protein
MTGSLLEVQPFIPSVQFRRTLLGLLVISPLMQIGISYYLSFSLAIFLMTYFVSTKLFVSRFLSLESAIRAIAITFLLSIPYLFTGFDSRSDILRLLKDVLFLSILFYVLDNTLVSRKLIDFKLIKQLKAVLYVLSFLMFFLVILQSSYISRRSPLFINPDFFARNSENIATQSTFLLFDRLRPSGTFGEPSYLSWYLFFLICALCLLSRTYLSKLDIICIALNVFSIVLSQSGLGFVFLLLLFVFRELKSVGVLFRRLLLVGLTSYLITTVNSLLFSQQLSKSFDIRSWSARVVKPFELYNTFIASNPFGIPLRRIFSNDAPYSIGDVYLFEVIAHGLSYFVFGFGIIGIAIILWISLASRRLDSFTLFFFLFSFFQNGSFLDFDKIGLLMLLVLVSKLSAPTSLNAHRDTSDARYSFESETYIK